MLRRVPCASLYLRAGQDGLGLLAAHLGGKGALRRRRRRLAAADRAPLPPQAHEERCTKVMWEELEVACNTWVYCSYPLCWSNDVWNHSRGECWLKHQKDPTRPNAGSYGAYPEGYRKKHHTAPERVQWMSGVLATGHVVVDGPHWHW